jgi:RNA polymerase sigma-70 factor
MSVEAFRKAFKKEIDEALGRIQRRYSVDANELALAFHSSAKKYLPELVDQSKLNPHPTKTTRSSVAQFLASLNHEDLCLALACAKGDGAAWEDFVRDYRTYLISIARTMTSDAGAAEQLADSAFADLYGLRESDGARVSKFSFYSGRGSLKGWLRAVVFQLSADHHRQSSRYVQTDEPEDIERMAQGPAEIGKSNGSEMGYIRERYRSAVSEALGRAIAQLAPRERLLLAHYYYDEMTLREIGRLFDVHEATICRWLVKVQKHTRKLVEKSLSHDHRFNRREVAEAIQLAAEQLDIEVREYLFDSGQASSTRDHQPESAGGAIAQG